MSNIHTREDARAFVKANNENAVYEALIAGSHAKERAELAQHRGRTQRALIAGIAAEFAGAAAGGALVGFMRAKKHEEMLIPVAAGLTLAGAYWRITKPNDQKGELLFSAGAGQVAALIAVETENAVVQADQKAQSA